MSGRGQPGESRPGWRTAPALAQALPPSSGTRDLFPLPELEVPEFKGGCGRTARSRRRRGSLQTKLVNDAVAALNWMRGHKAEVEEAPLMEKHRGMHERMWSIAHHRIVAAPTSLPKAEAAAKTLLRTGAGYTDGPRSGQSKGGVRLMGGFVK